MTLKEFMAMSNKFVCPEDRYRFVQMAYEDTVKKIRIAQHMFPVIMNGSFRDNSFSTKHKVGNKTICFKQLRCLLNSVVNNPISPIIDSNPLEIFEFDPENFHGIDEERFLAVNDNQESIPELEIKRDIVHCANITGDVFFFLYAYPYPYFVRNIDPVVESEHEIDNYDLMAMADVFNETELIVDDALVVLMIPKILALAENYIGNIGISSTMDYHHIQVINKFNMADELFEHNSFTSLAELTGSM